MRGSRRERCHEAPCLQEVPGQTPKTWKLASSLKEHTAGTILLHSGTAAVGAGAGTTAVGPPRPAAMGAGAGTAAMGPPRPAAVGARAGTTAVGPPRPAAIGQPLGF